MYFKKATRNDVNFSVNLTLCSKCQIDTEDFVNFCGFLRKHELYKRDIIQLFSADPKMFLKKSEILFCTQ